MPLTMLDNATLPMNPQQAHKLLDNVVQLNNLDSGCNERMQRAIGLLLEIHSLFAKTRGQWDFTGRAGHERLKDVSMAFVGPGNHIITRYQDLSAAHLAIDYHNCQARMISEGLQPLPDRVDQLLELCADLYQWAEPMEQRADLTLSFIKKHHIHGK